MAAIDRFLRYIKVHTTSDPQSENVPSTERQLDLAHLLKDEMDQIGFVDAEVSTDGYVYGWLPATSGMGKIPPLGLIAHMDTSPDFCGANVCPQLIENYDGCDVKLGKSGRVLSVQQFPELPSLKGRTLVTTDGTTLLGADNKAGIAEILDACERLVREEIPHGEICVAFTPDEEIGRGADHFDIEKFGATYAYTVDGDVEGDINFENFNAASATISINGFNIHPGSATNVMINASLIAFEFNALLPGAETPRNTELREGFFHLTEIQGDVEKAEMKYILRDHSKPSLDSRVQTLKHIEKFLNQKYGADIVRVQIQYQYENMEKIIRDNWFLIEKAEAAMRVVGIKPHQSPIRGGTDGARLSFMGMPCPNLCTGSFAFHGPYEHTTVEGLDICSRIIVELVKQFN